MPDTVQANVCGRKWWVTQVEIERERERESGRQTGRQAVRGKPHQQRGRDVRLEAQRGQVDASATVVARDDAIVQVTLGVDVELVVEVSHHGEPHRREAIDAIVGQGTLTPTLPNVNASDQLDTRYRKVSIIIEVHSTKPVPLLTDSSRSNSTIFCSTCSYSWT